MLVRVACLGRGRLLDGPDADATPGLDFEEVARRFEVIRWRSAWRCQPATATLNSEPSPGTALRPWCLVLWNVVACRNECWEPPLNLARRQPDPFSELRTHTRAVGLDWGKVRAALPECTSSAVHHETGRIEVEGFIARHFGYRLRPDGGFEPAALPQAVFKVRRDTDPADVVAARGYGTAVAHAVARATRTPWNGMPPDAAGLRRLALEAADGRGWVDFAALVEASWRLGIPVIYLPELPVAGRKPDGMATFVGGRPVAVLLKSQSLAEWMVFILAHELGVVDLAREQPPAGGGARQRRTGCGLGFGVGLGGPFLRGGDVGDGGIEPDVEHLFGQFRVAKVGGQIFRDEHAPLDVAGDAAIF